MHGTMLMIKSSSIATLFSPTSGDYLRLTVVEYSVEPLAFVEEVAYPSFYFQWEVDYFCVEFSSYLPDLPSEQRILVYPNLVAQLCNTHQVPSCVLQN